MTSSRSWAKTTQCNTRVHQNRADRRSLTTSADNRPCTSIVSAYISFLQQQKPTKSMKRVTTCQGSMHLPLEPYVSCKIFEQIIYSSSTTTIHSIYGIPCIQVHRSSYRG